MDKKRSPAWHFDRVCMISEVHIRNEKSNVRIYKNKVYYSQIQILH